jgi:hypothetical protein
MYDYGIRSLLDVLEGDFGGGVPRRCHMLQDMQGGQPKRLVEFQLGGKSLVDDVVATLKDQDSMNVQTIS